MGAAATQRGDSSIHRGLWATLKTQSAYRDEAMAVQIAEDCNTFVRQSLEYLVEPKGMRSTSVERAKTRRGWESRQSALTKAHADWVDADCRRAYAYHGVCVARAKAAYNLLTFALGTWTIPDHINVPRAAIAS